MHLCHQCLQQDKTQSEFAGSLSFLPLCLQNNVCTWHAPADRCSSQVLFLHFLPLFAQRLRAIIGPNALHYSYLCAHTQVQKTSACNCAQEENTRLPATANMQLLPLAFRLTLCPVWFCQVFWGPSQLAASLKGATLQGKSRKTNRWVPLSLVKPLLPLYPPPPFIYQISTKRRTAPCREQTLDLQESTPIRQ